MYGWRGRIGLMIPYDNTVIEPEFARSLPNGVSAHVIRSSKTDRRELAEESLILAPNMAHLRVKAVLYACGASSFIQGRAWHDSFLARFQSLVGVPCETATSAMLKLIAHRNLRRLCIVTPYPEWLMAPLRAFLEQSGVELANLVALGLEPPEINQLGPEHSYSLAKSADTANADGVFIMATNFRTLEVLETLQQELGKPVMSSNQALMWAAKEILGLPQEETAAPESKMQWPSA